MGQQLFIFGAAFLGSAVESTEALTIVLAVGLTRGWRAPLMGTLVAIVLLAILVIVFGQLIVTTVPEWALKLLVGTLLLLFGLRWLHKAVLRSAGVVAMHDEERAYQDAVSRLGETVGRRDWVGFVLALKGVFLEGLEVVFIVIAVGGPGHRSRGARSVCQRLGAKRRDHRHPRRRLVRCCEVRRARPCAAGASPCHPARVVRSRRGYAVAAAISELNVSIIGLKNAAISAPILSTSYSPRLATSAETVARWAAAAASSPAASASSCLP